MKLFIGCSFLIATCAWFGPGQRCTDLNSLQQIRGGQMPTAVPACNADVAQPDTGSCTGDSNCTTITLTNYKENNTNGDAIVVESFSCSDWDDLNGSPCGGNFVDEVIRLKTAENPETGEPYCQ